MRVSHLDSTISTSHVSCSPSNNACITPYEQLQGMVMISSAARNNPLNYLVPPLSTNGTRRLMASLSGKDYRYNASIVDQIERPNPVCDVLKKISSPPTPDLQFFLYHRCLPTGHAA
ncbi:unnamed protein product [Cuscuta epithymum]|uniref:Uncharacterized protein n=1 Tax=Cuscuta epithymum TaxID=186058 RepID=A0AAV0F5C3_9ASTE|nr:unnamed protein product [Cuscuta epithymum]